MMYPKYRLKLLLRDVEGSHDGNCSDPEEGSDVYTIQYIVDVIDLPENFASVIIEHDNSMTNNGIINLDVVDFSSYTEHYQHLNECEDQSCDMGSLREVIYAIIIDENDEHFHQYNYFLNYPQINWIPSNPQIGLDYLNDFINELNTTDSDIDEDEDEMESEGIYTF